MHGTAIPGRYVELEPPQRLLITWGREGSRTFLRPSTLEVRLTADGSRTQVPFVHVGLPADEATEHDNGSRYYLGRLDSGVATPLSLARVRGSEPAIVQRPLCQPQLRRI
jgi:uncharacterized protein YndB with AHSA1/START domain